MCLLSTPGAWECPCDLQQAVIVLRPLLVTFSHALIQEIPVSAVCFVRVIDQPCLQCNFLYSCIIYMYSFVGFRNNGQFMAVLAQLPVVCEQSITGYSSALCQVSPTIDQYPFWVHGERCDDSCQRAQLNYSSQGLKLDRFPANETLAHHSSWADLLLVKHCP